VGDFYCEEKYTFEFVASNNIEVGSGNKILLWLFKFLY
jgi:hypothetical protein